MYHEPIADRLFLSPWGADSTFIHAYPPSASNPECEPLYRDVDVASPVGWLMGFCQADATCRADLEAKLLDVADWMEDSDLVGRMAVARAMLDPWAGLETEVNWTLEDREARADCFLSWTELRPQELRDLVGR